MGTGTGAGESHSEAVSAFIRGTKSDRIHALIHELNDLTERASYLQSHLAPGAAGAAAAIGVTPHFSSNCFERSAASATVKLDKSSIILFRSGIFYSLGCVSEFSGGKLLIFSDRASKILTNFEAEAFKIPTIFALASSNVGKVATF